jgi:AP-2 complex subunit mu-1
MSNDSEPLETPFRPLCRYRSTSNIKLPLRILATVNEIGTTGVSYVVSIKANFDSKLSATSLVVRIPTPLNTTNVDCKAPNGKAKYVPAENVVVWKCVSCSFLMSTW